MKFVGAYMKFGDVDRASSEAGYSTIYGRRLIKSPDIQAYIAKMRDLGDIASLEEVMSHISSILRGDGEDTPIREQLKAAEALIKYHGASGAGSDDEPAVPIIIDNSDELED